MAKVDLTGIRQEVMDSITKANEDIVCKANKQFREDLISIGTQFNLPKFVKWVESLKDYQLTLLLHMGFSEKAFFETLTGKITMTGYEVERPEGN